MSIRRLFSTKFCCFDVRVRQETRFTPTTFLKCAPFLDKNIYVYGLRRSRGET